MHSFTKLLVQRQSFLLSVDLLMGALLGVFSFKCTHISKMQFQIIKVEEEIKDFSEAIWKPNL